MDFLLLLLLLLAEVKGIMGDVAVPSSSTWQVADLELQQCSGGECACDERIKLLLTPPGTEVGDQ